MTVTPAAQPASGEGERDADTSAGDDGCLEHLLIALPRVDLNGRPDADKPPAIQQPVPEYRPRLISAQAPMGSAAPHYLLYPFAC